MTLAVQTVFLGLAGAGAGALVGEYLAGHHPKAGAVVGGIAGTGLGLFVWAVADAFGAAGSNVKFFGATPSVQPTHTPVSPP